MATVLILEDEEYTLQFLELLVGKHPLVDKVIAVNNSQAAVTAAQSYLPQVALLDIELGLDDSFNGIQTAKVIKKVSPNTVGVFLTGYTKYALDAFSAHPYDYLLKPVQKEKVADLLTEIISLRDTPLLNNKVSIRVREGTILLNSNTILCIEKMGKKAIIYTEQNSYETSYNLTELQGLLPNQFARVHNSFIINLSRISMIKYTNNRSYQVVLENCPATVYMTRNKYEEYKHLFMPIGSA
jgi:DNA-binding LytR/AlgR family response regulator